MGRTIEGGYAAVPDKIGIVVSRFNEFITRRLLDGAVDCLRRHGVDDGNIDVLGVFHGALDITRYQL